MDLDFILEQYETINELTTGGNMSDLHAQYRKQMEGARPEQLQGCPGI